MQAIDIRREYMVEFQTLPKPHLMRGVVIMTSLAVQIVAAMALGGYALAHFDGMLLVATCAVAMIFIGSRLRAYNNITHECSHNTFVEGRANNRLIGSVASSMTLGCFKSYRDQHMTHHAHLGDYDHDEDLQGIKDLGLHDPLTRRTALRHLVTPLLGRHLPYYLHPDLSAADGRAFQAFKLALVGGAAIGLILAPLFTIVMVILPYALVYTAINYWTDCLDHAGLVAAGDDLYASRNVLAPKVLRTLFFPRNDCFHLVHHLFPQVPSDQLEKCHHRLLADSRYAALPNAARQTPANNPLPEGKSIKV